MKSKERRMTSKERRLTSKERRLISKERRLISKELRLIMFVGFLITRRREWWEESCNQVSWGEQKF